MFGRLYTFPLAALLLAAPVLRADDRYILGKDDADFARELARRGFLDLAKDVCSAIANTRSGDPNAVQVVKGLLIDLDAEAASRERDPKQRLKLLESIAKTKEEFVEAQKGTPAGDEAFAGLPDVYRAVGESIASLIRQETDPAEITRLREEGDTMFTSAERALNLRILALEGKLTDLQTKGVQKDPTKDPLEEANPAEQEVSTQIMLATYALIRTNYFHALVIDPADDRRGKLLAKALELFMGFQLDNSDNVLCFEGFVYEGLCYVELKKNDDAIKSFDEAIKLRETWERAGDGTWPMSRQAADVVSWAVLQKMDLFAKAGSYKEAVAAADDFLTTTPDALGCFKGLAILAAKADACKELGDQAGLEKAAKKLIDVDPRGPGGDKGRELLGAAAVSGGGKGLNLDDLMRLAEAAVGRGEDERAMSVCRQVMAQARGTAGVANSGAEACLLLGAIYAKKGQFAEATVVWDGGAERYAAGERASDNLWRAVNGYLELFRQSGRAMYKAKARERLALLASKYPSSPSAASAQLFEGKQLEAEGKLAEASKAFEAVPATSPARDEALYRAGNALVNEIRKQLQNNRKADVKALVDHAEQLLKQARTQLEAAAGKTLEQTTHERLAGLAFAARMALAGLFAIDGTNRAADVLPLLDGIEKQFPDDREKLATAWNLRLKALQQLGKVDDAVAMLDGQLAKDPKAKGIAPAAAALGRALDTRATEMAKKEGDSPPVEALFKKAVRYYLLGIAPQVRGDEPLRVEEVEAVADRLLALGLRFNGVPDTVDSFVDWNGKRKEVETWTEAAKLYEAVIQVTPSYRTLLRLGRTYGFLGKHKEAARIYAQLFEREDFVDVVAKKIKTAALQARPELLSAYLEFGVSAREDGQTTKDAIERAATFARASGIFETIVQSVAADSKIWWNSKYLQMQTLLDRGEYDTADVALRSIVRNNDDFDGGRFGMKEKFVALRAELDKHLPGKK